MAPQTQTQYERSWRYFVCYLRIHHFVNKKRIQFNMDLLLDYALWRFKRTGVAGDTIRGDITGINNFLSVVGLQIDLRRVKDNRLVKFYRGCDSLRKKFNIAQRYHRRALVDSMVRCMVAQLGSSPQEKVVRVLLIFAKQTAFRSHNYIHTKNGGMVRVGNLKFHFRQNKLFAMIITLSKSKTYQEYAPTQETRTLKCRCPDLCAVCETYYLIKDRFNRPHEGLFLLDNGFPVTYSIWRKLLKMLVEAIGLDPKYYPPHSLRIGEATDQNMRGVPLEQTMKFIKWKNRKSAMTYIRPDNEDFVKFQ